MTSVYSGNGWHQIGKSYRVAVGFINVMTQIGEKYEQN